MEKKDIIKEIKQYFGLKELLDPHTYNKFGENTGWQFLQKDFLEALLVVRRDIIKKPMVCNNWAKGGQYSQRGFRCNICDIPKGHTLKGELYNSGHCLGCAGDFSVPGMTAESVRKAIVDHKDMLPVNIRLEGGVSWLHIDILDPGRDDKVYIFNG